MMPNTGNARGAQMTRGSVALKKCGDSPEQIARRTGANLGTVGNWLRGYRRPGPDWRTRLLELYGIPPDDWDKPIDFAPPEVKSALLAGLADAHTEFKEITVVTSPGVDTPPSEVARQLVAQVQELRAAVQHDPLLTVDEKAKTLGRCAQTLTLVYRLTGEAADLSEAKILKAPAFARIVRALLGAVEPWPDAARAIGSALISLAQDS